MKKLLALALTTIFAATAATAVPIDISNAESEITGSTTMTLHHVEALGSVYYIDLSWDENRNVFAVADYGEEAPSMVGRWTIGADWGGAIEIFMIQFNEDGTLNTVEHGDGSWSQAGYEVEFLIFDSRTQFDGTIAADGEWASGQVTRGFEHGTWGGSRGW